MILGIDEVGRGPWAGPLVVGAVILAEPDSVQWIELNDSKKLSSNKRNRLSGEIWDGADYIGLGWVSAKELDDIKYQPEALQVATYRAICDMLGLPTPNSTEDFNAAIKNVELPFDEIIIDGTMNFLEGTVLEDMVSIIPKADAMIKSVSAASIVAKVARDDYMIELSSQYPEYCFDSNKGYGTPQHRRALKAHGLCPEHRLSVRPIRKLSPTTAVGNEAEDAVAKYLEEDQGHKIISRNFKTRTYEIDIVSAKDDHLYFTEVKYRRTNVHGTPLEAVSNTKERKMLYAAQCFMTYLSRKLDRPYEEVPSPILAVAAVEGPDFKITKWFTIND